jgi:hypothetical protein
MILSIIVACCSLLITIGVLCYVRIVATETPKLKKRLSKCGVEAEAVLLNVELTGTFTDNLPQVKLQMKVQPKIGRNFVTEINESFTRVEMARISAGSIVKVKYNPGNLKEIVLVK